MFFHYCGAKLPEEAVFCPSCGESLVQKTPNVRSARGQLVNTEKHKSSDDIYDRFALKIYLGNIRALECAKANLEEKMNNLNNTVKSLAIPRNISKPHKRYREDCIVEVIFAIIIAVIVILFDIIINGILPTLDSHIIRNIGIFAAVTIALYGIFKTIIKNAEVDSEDKEEEKRYQENMQKDRERVAKEYAEQQKLIPVVSGTKDEYSEVCELLEKAYAINIVPQQFRNIYAAYYLYDYITTSNESFTNALLQCNLEAIKSKLDVVISQQRQIIINQQIMMSQNREIMDQNDRQLARMEENQETAIKYTKIAANNAEACAWIGAANYLQLNDIKNRL